MIQVTMISCLKSWLHHDCLRSIPKPLQSLTHSTTFQIQRKVKLPLRMKVHRNLEQGHNPKIWAGIAPTFGTYRTPFSTQEASSSFNLLNTLLVKCTSLFLTSFTYNPNHLPNTSNSQRTFTTYLPWLPMIYTEISTFILTFRKF